MAEIYNVGIIGAGSGAYNLFKFLKNSEILNFSFICDRDEQAPLVALAKKRKIPFYKDMEEALSSHQDLDIVIDATGSKTVIENLCQRYPKGGRTKFLDSDLALILFKIIEGSSDDDGETNTIEEQYLSFKIEKEDYAFPLIEVMEIIMDQEITPLPNVMESLMGVINLRGEVIPVFSLRKMLSKEELKVSETEDTNKNCIIILMIDQKKYGVRVDTVNEVVQLGQNKIFPAPENTLKDNKEALVVIQGIGKVTEEQVVVLLGIEKAVGNIAIHA